MDISVSVTMAIKTCSCGTLYAVPNWVPSSVCPMCAHRTIKALNEDLQSQNEAQAGLERSISALKGALTKRRKT